MPGVPFLAPADVDGGSLEVDLFHLDVHELADAQRMAVGEQDQQTVADGIA